MKGIKNTITHDDVRAALAKFRKEGGMVTHLPDQDQPPATLVGAKWEAYETVFEAVPYFK